MTFPPEALQCSSEAHSERSRGTVGSCTLLTCPIIDYLDLAGSPPEEANRHQNKKCTDCRLAYNSQMDKLTFNGITALLAYKPCVLQVISIHVSTLNGKEYIM